LALHLSFSFHLTIYHLSSDFILTLSRLVSLDMLGAH